MAYRLVFERAAEKALKKRVRPDQAERVREALAALTEDPCPRNSRKLQNTENRRLRVGDYRVIYFVEETGDAPGTIYVLDVGHRQGVYGWVGVFGAWIEAWRGDPDLVSAPYSRQGRARDPDRGG